MSTAATEAAGSALLSRVFAFSALGVALIGGVMFGVGSLLAIDLAAAAVLEARWVTGYRPYLAWAALLLSVAAAAFFSYAWYSYFWHKYHHPGGGGPISAPRDLLSILLLASLGLGLIGLLGLIARYRGGHQPPNSN